jgi:hypothetical protein
MKRTDAKKRRIKQTTTKVGHRSKKESRDEKKKAVRDRNRK